MSAQNVIDSAQDANNPTIDENEVAFFILDNIVWDSMKEGFDYLTNPGRLSNSLPSDVVQNLESTINHIILESQRAVANPANEAVHFGVAAALYDTYALRLNENRLLILNQAPHVEGALDTLIDVMGQIADKLRAGELDRIPYPYSLREDLSGSLDVEADPVALSSAIYESAIEQIPEEKRDNSIDQQVANFLVQDLQIGREEALGIIEDNSPLAREAAQIEGGLETYLNLVDSGSAESVLASQSQSVDSSAELVA